MFFFPENKLQSALSFINQEQLKIKELQNDPDIMQIENAKYDNLNDRNTFNYHIRRYLGLGFLLSFLPGTEAYTARNKFSDSTQNLINSIGSVVPKGPLEWLSYYASTHGPILDLLSFGPLRRAYNHVMTRMGTHIATNHKLGFAAILGQAPILNEIRQLIFSYDGLNNFIHTLLNPMRLVDQALFFFQLVLNRVSEIGSDKNDASPQELKMIIAIPFAITFIPVTLLKEIFDIPYQLLNHMLYRPLKFFTHSVAQAFHAGHKEELSHAEVPSVTQKNPEVSKSLKSSHGSIMSSIAAIGNPEEHDNDKSTLLPEDLIDNTIETFQTANSGSNSPVANQHNMFHVKADESENDKAKQNPADNISNESSAEQEQLRTIFSGGQGF